MSNKLWAEMEWLVLYGPPRHHLSEALAWVLYVSNLVWLFHPFSTLVFILFSFFFFPFVHSSGYLRLWLFDWSILRRNLGFVKPCWLWLVLVVFSFVSLCKLWISRIVLYFVLWFFYFLWFSLVLFREFVYICVLSRFSVLLFGALVPTMRTLLSFGVGVRCPFFELLKIQKRFLFCFWENEELKAKANEQPSLTPIITSTHSPKTENKNTSQLKLTIGNKYTRIHQCQTFLFTTPEFLFWLFFRLFFMRNFFHLNFFPFFRFSCLFFIFFLLFSRRKWMNGMYKSNITQFPNDHVVHPTYTKNQPPIT